jgi:large subunit ribosomal protein L3
MACSFGMPLTRACSFLNNSLLSHVRNYPRVLVQLQHSRNGRRYTKARGWQVEHKKVNPYWMSEHLTSENRQYLEEVVEDVFSPLIHHTPLKNGPWRRNEWTSRTMRTGVLGVKIGVIPQWTKDGRRIHTTLIQILDNHVLRYTPPEVFMKSRSYHHKKWYKTLGSVVVGALSADPQKYTSQYTGLFSESGLPPKRKITRFLVTPDAAIQPGTPLKVQHFRIGDYVDVQAKTIGHGFQGVVKRWGFKGGPNSHGNTKFHRRPGSVGGGGDKSAIWKGKKMPGHMGMEWSTLRGLKVWRINTRYNILYVNGPCLPGPNHCYVRLYDTVLTYRKPDPKENPRFMPTFFPGDETETISEELFDENLFQLTEPTLTYEEEKAKVKR